MEGEHLKNCGMGVSYQWSWIFRWYSVIHECLAAFNAVA